MRVSSLRSIFIYFVLTVLGIVVLFPLLVTIANSFMSIWEIEKNYLIKGSVFDAIMNKSAGYINMKLVPTIVTTQQYSEILFKRPSYLLLFWNSIQIAAPIVIGHLVVSSMAAFAFFIMKSKYKELLFFVYIVIMLMPLQVTLVPNYIVMRFFGLENSYLAIILPAIFSPFGTFILRQQMKSMPPSYIESARVEGASNLSIFIKIVMPNCKSSLAALFMLTFVESWNLVDQAIVFVKEPYRQPLSVFLSYLDKDSVAVIFAASCFYIFPALLLLLIGQESLVKGIELSGIKE